jgi:hypothetical protein
MKISAAFCCMAKPREGQSLEEVEKLLLEQIENLRNGQFEDWLPGSGAEGPETVGNQIF